MIEEAKHQLESVRGITLSLVERTERAIILAKLLLQIAKREEKQSEARAQAQLHRLITDPSGKAFTTALADQVFRSRNPERVVDQVKHILKKYGVPSYLPLSKSMGLHLFNWLGACMPRLSTCYLQQQVRKEARRVIHPAEKQKLKLDLKKRSKEGVRINLNHIGEAILGEEEARRRLESYLNDLADPAIEYVSIKISTLYSQLSLRGWEHTLYVLKERLRALYRAAQPHAKFVNLDMEEYRDLPMTVALFCEVLEESEFQKFSAGIVLQSYLPDAFALQKQLTEWAKDRVVKGGAPIKIRLVKGANLAMEQVEASLRDWPQAPYPTKCEVDANFKRMVIYACQPENGKAVYIGIGSHNLFDIAFALLLRSENRLENCVNFEMLEGMAEGLRKAVQAVSGDMLLYSPVANREEFQYAIAYLVRRLDENTAPENFLRDAFGLVPGSIAWDRQLEHFKTSCQKIEQVSSESRRTQNRLKEVDWLDEETPFENEPDTDWTLLPNRHWAARFDKKNVNQSVELLNEGHLEPLIKKAVQAQLKWSQQPLLHRSRVLYQIAHALRKERGQLIQAMVTETHKTVSEADSEVSEAIDFAEYYRRQLQELYALENVIWTPKGVVLVAPPWNFPCSISAGGILGALISGNSVLFKPAPEAIRVGLTLAQIFWEAGIDRDVLQFVPCLDEPIGSLLIRDPRIAMVVLTGATETAKFFHQLRPGLDLAAETGGKNALIITALADRDLAIRDLIQSAFGYAGQKCSACSLAILEAEVYDDPQFRRTLRDAAASLLVGSPWNYEVKVNPLIHSPNKMLERGLTQLEPDETWLLQPVQMDEKSNLWSPGIKWGVQPGSFTHQNELFGPVLGVMRAESLSHAIELANGTKYGLTSGLHSLDEREHTFWIKNIVAGNCYINRGITGAIVQRQPLWRV